MKNPNEPRTLTEAQIAANRENAKKSTGPRTAEGKAASSRNRLLHGLRANKHILLDDDQPEDFLLLLKSLDAAFRPVGEGEEMLVTQIAADQWRLDRALPMEAGIYRRRLEGVAADDYSRKRELINEKRNHERDPENYSPAPAPPDPDDRLTRAFIADCAKPNSLANLNRYKSGIQLSIDRSLRQLKIYQAARIASTPEVRQAAPPAEPDPAVAERVGPLGQAVPPADATNPQNSMNYHSNPTNDDIAGFGVLSASAAMLLAALTLLHAVPELIAALGAQLIGLRVGYNRLRTNLFHSLVPQPLADERRRKTKALTLPYLRSSAFICG
ncbi:MAG TPA: hypothetical protein VN924_14315 [Bryobacteraceae bacterium]|nr:hypothetical protein [Bryobacteraceae bacterium]